MILVEFWARDEAGFSTLVRRRELAHPKEKEGMKRPLQIGGQKPGKLSGMGIKLIMLKLLYDLMERER